MKRKQDNRQAEDHRQRMMSAENDEWKYERRKKNYSIGNSENERDDKGSKDLKNNRRTNKQHINLPNVACSTWLVHNNWLNNWLKD